MIDYWIGSNKIKCLSVFQSPLCILFNFPLTLSPNMHTQTSKNWHGYSIVNYSTWSRILDLILMCSIHVHIGRSILCGIWRHSTGYKWEGCKWIVCVLESSFLTVSSENMNVSFNRKDSQWQGETSQSSIHKHLKIWKTNMFKRHI